MLMETKEAKVFCLTHKATITYFGLPFIMRPNPCEVLVFDLREEKPKSIAFTKDSFPAGDMPNKYDPGKGEM